MKSSTAYLALGGAALLLLSLTIAAGFFQHENGIGSEKRLAIGAPMTERQALSRRRANVGVPAIAGATVQ